MRSMLKLCVIFLGALSLSAPAVAQKPPKAKKKTTRTHKAAKAGKHQRIGVKGDKAKVKKVSIEWVTLPGGSFQMGDADDPAASPIHQVQVERFKLGKHEVTVAEYKACFDAKKCTKPGQGAGCNWGRAGRADYPINCVDWHQAKAFAAWVGGRLPTEAEWEYAARSAGKVWKQPWGNGAASCNKATLKVGGDGCGKRKTAKVCSKKGGVSQQGVCDLIGNVEEWVADGYRRGYAGASSNARSYVRGGRHKVTRGGSWLSRPTKLNATTRKQAGPMLRLPQTGFRVAR